MSMSCRRTRVLVIGISPGSNESLPYLPSLLVQISGKPGLEDANAKCIPAGLSSPCRPPSWEMGKDFCLLQLLAFTNGHHPKKEPMLRVAPLAFLHCAVAPVLALVSWKLTLFLRVGSLRDF